MLQISYCMIERGKEWVKIGILCIGNELFENTPESYHDKNSSLRSGFDRIHR
jgi:hypothetical protein